MQLHDNQKHITGKRKKWRLFKLFFLSSERDSIRLQEIDISLQMLASDMLWIPNAVNKTRNTMFAEIMQSIYSNLKPFWRISQKEHFYIYEISYDLRTIVISTKTSLEIRHVRKCIFGNDLLIGRGQDSTLSRWLQNLIRTLRFHFVLGLIFFLNILLNNRKVYILGQALKPIFKMEFALLFCRIFVWFVRLKGDFVHLYLAELSLSDLEKNGYNPFRNTNQEAHGA